MFGSSSGTITLLRFYITYETEIRILFCELLWLMNYRGKRSIYFGHIFAVIVFLMKY